MTRRRVLLPFSHHPLRSRLGREDHIRERPCEGVLDRGALEGHELRTRSAGGVIDPASDTPRFLLDPIEHTFEIFVEMLVGDLDEDLARQAFGEQSGLFQRCFSPAEDHDLRAGGGEAERGRATEVCPPPLLTPMP